MAKCTTERPRHGRSWAITKKYGGSVRVSPDREHDYPEEYGGFRSSSRKRQINPKGFSDFLSPLRGAIRKNVGRPWDKVFGEFCEALDRRGLSGYHIWTHLMWEVETKTFIGEDGEVYGRPAFGGRPSKVDGFFVHPLTGLLLYKQPRRFRPLKNTARSDIPVPENEPQVYRRIDGLWFRCLVNVEIRNLRPYRTEVVVRRVKSASRKEIAWIEAQLAP
ncbi:hypothetical protein [Occallatibacter riparius]|uniref:Uncharacterized protein n=1 Tax=Occallatibacter riparius TaxID=1002689 RepID=A0A9J7BT59_9BACT|nr:hypothetical protein [Occallatibacter riparius]UWZ85832.1 hypothetical protein MOP44_07770 [Occallatibacter riparius]